jgi:tetratricopeptide (TPR) repeat protein
MRENKRKYGLAILASLLCVAFSVNLAAQEIHKMGYDAYKKGDYRRAIDLFKQVTNDFPDWFFGHYMLGASYKAAGNYKEAVTSLKVAANFIDNDDDKFKVYYYMADSEYNLKDYKNALDHVSTAYKIKNTKGYSKAVENMVKIKGFSEFNLKKYGDAIATFEPLVSSDQADSNILKTTAICYQNLNQDKKAIEIIQKVVRVDPADINAHKILIKSRINDRSWNAAIADANYAIANHPGDWELYSLKGFAEYRNGKLSDAVASLQKSLEKQNNSETHKLLGDVFVEAGQFDKAVIEYDLAQRGGEYADDPGFFTKFAFAWFSFVPSAAEQYHGTSKEAEYKRALENAKTLLDHASRLQGFDQNIVDGILIGINNKFERLEKGQYLTEITIITIDPETGKIVEKKVGQSEEDKKKKPGGQ